MINEVRSNKKFYKRKERMQSNYPNFFELVKLVTGVIPGIYTTALVKVLYFLELEYKLMFGENFSETPFVRINMGPVPDHYKDHLSFMEANNQIERFRHGRGMRHFSNGSYCFTDIELDVFQTKLIFFKSKINTLSAEDGINFVKNASYDTFPMIRLVEIEENMGTSCKGVEVLKKPFFTERDIDPLAKERRAYRDRLRRCNRHTREDSILTNQVMNDFQPLLDKTNRVINIYGDTGSGI